MLKFILFCVPAVVAFGGSKTMKAEAEFNPKEEPIHQIETRQCNRDCGCDDDCTAGLMTCGAEADTMGCYGKLLGGFGVDGTCLQKCNEIFNEAMKNSMSKCVYNCYNSCNPATDWQNYCPEELQNYAKCPNSWSSKQCLPQCSDTCLNCVEECGADGKVLPAPGDDPTDSPAAPGCVDDPTGDIKKAGASCAMLKGMGCDTDLSTMDPTTPKGTFVKMMCPASCDACATAPAASSCVDDPTGDIKKAGASCAMLKGMGCDTDLSTMNPTTPKGTFVKMVCPASCDACD